MSRKARIYTALISIGLLNIGLWSLIGVSHAHTGRLLPGTIIQGQSFSGLTRQDAVNRLIPVHEELAKQPVTLALGAKTYTATLPQLGYTIDTIGTVNNAISQSGARHFLTFVLSYVRDTKQTVVTKLVLDPETQATFVATLQESLSSDANDISLDFQDGKLVVMPPEMGVTLDPKAVEATIAASVNHAIEKKSPLIKLPVIEEKPLLLEEAQIAEAKSHVEHITSNPLSLKTEDQAFQIQPETIFSFIVFTAQNNQLEVTFDETKIKTQVDVIAKKANITPLAKKVSTVNNITLTEGRDGRRINTSDAVNQIASRLNSGTFDPPIVLAAEKIERQTVNEEPEYQVGRTQGKYVEIDLSSQRLYLISDQTIDMVTAVSTGKWSTPTPIGEFTIKNHLRTAWSNRFKLYMPFWMAIQKPSGEYDGYGMHGLPYWPNGFVEGESHIGRPASHGCIRIGSEVVQYAYDWVQDGTKVFIHE